MEKTNQSDRYSVSPRGLRWQKDPAGSQRVRGLVINELTSSVTFRNAAEAMALSSFTSSSGVILSSSGTSTKINTPDEVVF